MTVKKVLSIIFVFPEVILVYSYFLLIKMFCNITFSVVQELVINKTVNVWSLWKYQCKIFLYNKYFSIEICSHYI